MRDMKARLLIQSISPSMKGTNIGLSLGVQGNRIEKRWGYFLYSDREYIHIIVFFKHIVKLKYYLETAQMSLHPFISTISFTLLFISFTLLFKTWYFKDTVSYFLCTSYAQFFLSPVGLHTVYHISACPLTNLHCSACTFIMIYPIHQYQLLLLPSIQFIYSPS